MPRARLAAFALTLCFGGLRAASGQTPPPPAPASAPSAASSSQPAPSAGDPRPRLALALRLQREHDLAGAIATLQGLITDYPELPEPYNDLAVLYASQGHYELAREQLLMALRTNPAYATASANLGDVELRLAEQAYRRTLRADGDAGAQAHARAMLRELQRLDATAHPTPSRP